MQQEHHSSNIPKFVLINLSTLFINIILNSYYLQNLLYSIILIKTNFINYINIFILKTYFKYKKYIYLFFKKKKNNFNYFIFIELIQYNKLYTYINYYIDYICNIQ